MRTLLPVALLTSALAAQTVTVDYPDGIVIGTQGQYPIYTGGGLNVVRGQSYCPGTFVGLPTTPMFCTRIGLHLGGATAGYSQFKLRLGATAVAALTNTWVTNLPDQRIQVELSGTTITPPLPPAIVEYALSYPFLYTPGQGIVLDITAQSQVAGVWCGTTLGATVPRVVSTNYVGAATGTLSTGGGLKFRLVFEPLAIVKYGTGCPGTGSFVPSISSAGQSSLGSTNYFVNLSNGLGGAPAVFTLGMQTLLDLGGGCRIYNDLLFALGVSTTGTGAGNGTASFFLPIPNNGALLTALFDTQYGVLDTASPGIIPFAFTPSGKIVIY